MTGTIDISEKSIIDLAKEVLQIEASSITELINRLGNNFVEAVDLLYKCKGRVIVTGMGKSGIIGKKIAATLSSTGTPAFYLHPAESTHGDSGVITRDDIIIAISNSGETGELLQLLPLIKRFNINLIALTGKLNSTLALKSDITIDISVEKEACPMGLAPTASTTATLAMGDALAVCLLKKRGFTPEDFLMFHPSGSLGKSILYKVEDLMITGDKLPLIDANTKFQDAIIEISDKKLGIAIIMENSKISGILSDGDIRRTVIKHADISSLVVKDVMSINPKTIKTDELAAKALHIMEKYSITSIIVSDNNSSVDGLIHIHDLLKAGVT